MSIQRSNQARDLFLLLAGGGGLAFFIASSVSNVSNFFFHVAMSRILGPATYGALGSLLGLVTVILLTVGALQAAVTQAVAAGVAHRDHDVRLALRSPLATSAVMAIALFVLVSASSPLLKGFLHLSSEVPVVLIGLFASLSVVSLMPAGVLLGRLSFRPVAAALVLSAAVRLCAGVAMAEGGLGLDGAVAASVLGAGAALAVLMWPFRAEVRTRGGLPLDVRFGSALLAVLALGGVSAFTGVDSFLARHFLARTASGYYVAAATGGRIALFVPSAIALVVFPRFAASHGAGPDARKLLVLALAAVGFLSGLAAAGILIFPHLVISVLFGASYQAAASAMRILAVGAAAIGLITILVYFHLARRSKASLLIWLGVAGAANAIGVWHSGLTAIAWTMLGVTGVLLVVIAVAAFAAPDVRGIPEIAKLMTYKDADDELDLSIVVPFYNPGDRLRPTISRLMEALTETGVTFEVIAVSDGSTDRSEETLIGFSPAVLRCVCLHENKGKGEALRVGLALGRGRYLGFIDADGDIPPSQVASLVTLMRSHQPDIVLGSKRHAMSEVVYPPLRKLYSLGWQLMVVVLFQLRVRDTQTGLKIIRRDVLAGVLPRMLEKRFTFDLELLVVARHLGYRRFVEAPVHIQERFGSTISTKTVWNMFVDALAIFYRLRILHYYDENHATVAPVEIRPRDGVYHEASLQASSTGSPQPRVLGTDQ
ncbi:MAG: glycosyltransferase [Acidimicrobiales bacterium]|jgi:O-antigen/teichoic acid export membrane protein/glycosyltransferase involved in cell wall biosynthesis